MPEQNKSQNNPQAQKTNMDPVRANAKPKEGEEAGKDRSFGNTTGSSSSSKTSR